MQIIIYSKSNCPNCVAAKQLLDKSGLHHIELSLDDPDIRNGFTTKYPDLKQMPQVFVNGNRVGGLAGLKAWALETLKSLQ